MSKEVTNSYDPHVSLEEVEREWIAKSVVHHGGNMVEAAKSLKISRAKLYRRLEKISNPLKSDQNGDANGEG